MFEVDPNLWLQSFASPWLTALMQAVTFLGYDWFYIAVILVVGFALRLRPMLGVMLALLLAGLCTHAAKDALALPRPVQVDARVLDHGHANRQWKVQSGGATSFIALPSNEAIAAQRASSDPDFGFISGHVAAATALCVALWLFFGARSRWLRVALLAWPVLMALSRMYLGRHFLGDVIGGAVAGIGAAYVARWLWTPEPGRTRALAVLAVGLCAAALAWRPLDPSTLGQLLGLAATAALLATPGFPDDRAHWAKRAARVLLALLLYAATRVLLQGVDAWGGWPDTDPTSIPLKAIGTFAVLYGTLWLARQLGFYDSTLQESTPTRSER